MSGIRNIAKGGWHPKKDNSSGGKGISARGDFKGINQMAGWVGKGKKPGQSDYDSENHMSAPLSTLKDPASFGPPPKHVHYHGAAAAAATSSPTSASSTSGTPTYSRAPPRPPGGLGAPVPHDVVQQQHEQQRAAEEEANRPAPPPVPYRVNTTGFNASNLPAPPVRRVEHGEEAEVASPPPLPGHRPGHAPSSRPVPTPPPSLPPRQNEHPNEYTPDPPPAYNVAASTPHDGYINQSAANRLAQAGVSVPALGVGRETAASPSQGQPPAGQLTELQQRFARMNKPSSPTGSQPESQTASAGASIAAGKKAPPPPPKKKGLAAQMAQQEPPQQDGPPPIPLASRPTM